MNHRANEQQLIDISFQIAETMFQHRRHFVTFTVDQRMEWVANQLRSCGFDTEPHGASWGVLK
jgi:hypothetical protein